MQLREGVRARLAAIMRDRVLLSILGVSFALFVLQVIVFRTVALDFDEAIYASQFAPGKFPLQFDAHRSRGMSFLAAPSVLLTDSVEVLRVYLAAIHIGGMALAAALFRRWIGGAAAVVVAVLGSSWVATLTTTLLMPNLTVAILALIAVGFLIRDLNGVGGSSLIGMAVALALAFEIRFPDGIWLAAALSLTVLVHRKGIMKRLVFVGAGSVIGSAVWIIEAYLRFGDPIKRFRLAAEAHAYTGLGIVQQASLLDGPPAGPDRVVRISRSGIAWWIVMAALVALVLVRRIDDPARRRVFRVTAGAGLVMAIPYFFLIKAYAPRFMLPAYALIAVPMAGAIWRARRDRIAVVLAIALIGSLPWHARMSATWLERDNRLKQGRKDVGLLVKDMAAGRPCSLVSTRGFPAISWYSSCRSNQILLEDAETYLAERAGSGDAVYLLSAGTAVPAQPYSMWKRAFFRDSKGRRWRIYTPPGQEPYAGAERAAGR